MKTITFECETITPMFLSGADGKTPELRPPSIKSAMRFWWRSLNPDLVKKTDKGFDYSELRKNETELFGGTEHGGKRSKVIISVALSTLEITTAFPTPHKENPFPKKAISIGSSFYVSLSFNENEIMNTDQVKNLFVITSILGGLGNRSRRGFGSFKILKIDGTDFNQPDNKEEIENFIRQINKSYAKLNFSPDFPYLQSIEIGKEHADLTKMIGKATHDIKLKFGWKYNNAMGDSKNRFSSPIYVSVIKRTDGKLYPIISTLNTVPPNNGKFDTEIQNDFKNSLT
ncbi:MAG: type III-B CRISPR module RAMP protein Cmr1 [Candidatus Delongbacteria bacterium]|nr:type III-B CRISPR module RAMP protein Cmr1 [Candidatus Delongbacteria bacterium]